MHWKGPVQVVVVDPKRKDREGRPLLVFIQLNSLSELEDLNQKIATGQYRVLNELTLERQAKMAWRTKTGRPRKPRPGEEIDDLEMPEPTPASLEESGDVAQGLPAESTDERAVGPTGEDQKGQEGPS